MAEKKGGRSGPANSRLAALSGQAQKFNNLVYLYNQHERWFRDWETFIFLEAHIVERVLYWIDSGTEDSKASGEDVENEDTDGDLFQTFEELLLEMKAEGPITQ